MSVGLALLVGLMVGVALGLFLSALLHVAAGNSDGDR